MPRRWRCGCGAGYAALCPHLNTACFDGACADESFLAGGLELLRRCDLVVLAPRWETSRGTLQEVAEAQAQDIPVWEWRAGELAPVDRLPIARAT